MRARTSTRRKGAASKPRSATAASTTDLATIAALLGRGDHPAALAAALAAWRAEPTDALADAIDAIGRKVPDDPVEQQLAAAITPRVVSTLARWKPIAKLRDPRVSRFAIAQLVALPFTNDAAEPLLHAFFATVIHLEDGRIARHADAIRDGIEARFVKRQLKTNLHRDLAAACKLRPRPAPLAPALAEAIRALGASTRTDAELLAAIYANPADDGPRAVYADFLQEKGDPRGELIALQLANPDGAPSERELALLKKHGKAWLGGLAPALSWGRGYSRTTFRRGFVSNADVILSVGKKLALVAKDPGWATVERIDSYDIEAVLLHAPLRALRELENQPDDEMFAKLAAANVTLPALAMLALEEHAPIDLAVARRVCPALSHLRLWRHQIGPTILPELAKLDVPRITLQRYWPASPAELRTQIADHEAVIAALATTKPLGKVTDIFLYVPINKRPTPTPLHFVRAAKGGYTRAVGS